MAVKKGIKTKIEWDELYFFTVDWDIEYWDDYPPEEPNGIQSNIKEEYRDIWKINKINVEVKGQGGADMSHIFTKTKAGIRLSKALEDKLLEMVKDKSIDEL